MLHDAGLLTSQNVQFQWLAGECRNFDDYLATFNAEKRRKVRARRRRVSESGLVIETRHGDEVESAEWPTLHALYASTFDKFGNYPVLTQCLAGWRRHLGEKWWSSSRATVAKRSRYRCAFAAMKCFTVVIGDVPANIPSLHFELCFYQGIAYCLQEGLKRFRTGRRVASTRSPAAFRRHLVHSSHWIADPAMHRLIARHLEQQGDAIKAYRDDAAEHFAVSGGGGGKKRRDSRMFIIRRSGLGSHCRSPQILR